MYHIKPKKYIKNKEVLQNFECRICYEISEQPQICQGPCHIILCPCCISSIKKNIGGCPQRCSKPLKVQMITGLNIQFDCPWNKELCKQPLKSSQQFLDHLSKCEYVSAEWKDINYNMSHYLCGKGHKMLFLDEALLQEFYGFQFYEKAINSVCSHCEEVGLCRTICPTCSTKENLVLFCTKCSKPPCIKTSCPYSHSFSQRVAYSNSNICDMCGKPSRMVGMNVYRDQKCNFDICQVCYDELPEQHPLVPFERDVNMLAHLLPEQQHHPPQNFLEFFFQNHNMGNLLPNMNDNEGINSEEDSQDSIQQHHNALLNQGQAEEQVGQESEEEEFFDVLEHADDILDEDENNNGEPPVEQ